jgi:pyruvate dehydrogenase E2 component (dihydrolipoamide acetyltransferase)
MATIVPMPKWGLLMREGTVTEWLLAEGDQVRAGEPLFTVETDKATNDVDAPHDGVLRRIVATAGAKVAVTAPVAVLSSPGETVSDDELDAMLAAAEPAEQTRAVAPIGSVGRRERSQRSSRIGERTAVSPAARKRARELGVDLAKVTPTGPGGRVTLEDVERDAATAQGAPAPTAQAAAAGETWIEAGPHRIHVLTVGDGPPLVLLHGLGGSLMTWQGVADAMSQRNRVILVDLPGHGASSAPDPGECDYSPAALARAVADTVAALCDAPAVVAGHSLGGAIAALMATASPQLVARLVLIDPAGVGDDADPELMRLIEAKATQAGSREILELFFHDRALVTSTGVAEHSGMLAQPGVHAAVRAAARSTFDGAAQRLDVRRALADSDVPVLVIWGAEDRVFDVCQAHALTLAVPHAQVRIVEEAGHVPHVERPDAVVGLIDAFLTG